MLLVTQRRTKSTSLLSPWLHYSSCMPATSCPPRTTNAYNRPSVAPFKFWLEMQHCQAFCLCTNTGASPLLLLFNNGRKQRRMPFPPTTSSPKRRLPYSVGQKRVKRPTSRVWLQKDATKSFSIGSFPVCYYHLMTRYRAPSESFSRCSCVARVR